MGIPGNAFIYISAVKGVSDLETSMDYFEIPGRSLLDFSQQYFMYLRKIVRKIQIFTTYSWKCKVIHTRF